MDENVTGKENVELPDARQTSDSGDGKQEKKYGDTKVRLTLRILVSAYVLYLAYGLIEGFGETAGSDRVFIAIAIAVFIAAGGAILILSAKKLIRKEYVDADGQADGDEEQ